MLDKYLNYLGKAEGILIHYNKGEDIPTLPYGVYNKPDSKLHNYIVSIARDMNINRESKDWDKEDIDKINSVIIADENIYKFAKMFYESFLLDARLELYPVSCKDVIVSLYTNSPKYCVMAVQRAVINMFKSNRLRDVEKDEVSTDDGIMGPKTENILKAILNKDITFHWYFEEAIISNMSDIYEEIANSDTKKLYLQGWKNRVKYFRDKE